MSLPIENERIKKVIDFYCDGNELLFSNEIGISQPRINRLFNKDSRNNKYPLPSFEIIQAITNKFIDVSAEWLLTGRGEMKTVNNTASKASEDRSQEKIIQLQERLIEQLNKRVNEMELLVNDVKKSKTNLYSQRVAESRPELEHGKTLKKH